MQSRIAHKTSVMKLFVKESGRSYREATPADIAAALRTEVIGAQVMDSPTLVKQYLCAELAHLDHEVFGVLFLDAQHRVIAFDAMFRGTLTQTSVYPREVVRAALQHNAAALVLTHNHPSGHPQPSRADEHLTRQLKDACALVDVRILDHVIVATGNNSFSFAEGGLL